MNGIVRSFCKFPSTFGLLNVAERNITVRTIRNCSFNCLQTSNINTRIFFETANKYYLTKYCYSTNSSKTELELVTFLGEEIAIEQQNNPRIKTISSKIYDFEVKLNGSEILLVKKNSKETVEVNFSVNESVAENEGSESDNEEVSLKSKPIFDVDIKRNDTVIGFTCFYVSDVKSNDIFTIDQMTIYEGEWKESDYCVSRKNMSDNMYYALMKLLEEKGITANFVVKMSELCTDYERSLYISLLNELRTFLNNSKS